MTYLLIVIGVAVIVLILCMIDVYRVLGKASGNVDPERKVSDESFTGSTGTVGRHPSKD